MQSSKVTPLSQDQDSPGSSDARLTWESPKLEKLHVSLDTAIPKNGSNADGSGVDSPG